MNGFATVHNAPMSDAAALTDLIQRVQAGDEAALRVVFDRTYEELRRLARARLGRSPRNTWLDTTSLVHESYLRFANAGELRIEDRAHFMRYAGHVMRSVIVDFIRQRTAERRGGGDALADLRAAQAGMSSDADRSAWLFASGVVDRLSTQSCEKNPRPVPCRHRCCVVDYSSGSSPVMASTRSARSGPTATAV
jgi:RNA polymerase sigma factor (TIGR02999 family)